MRVKSVHIAVVIFLACGGSAPRVSAQNPDTMMPEQSVAKGKQILADLISALGGPGYTEVRESQCQGRRVEMCHNGLRSGNIDR